MSMQSCQAKFPVRPASHLHCATKTNSRMSLLMRPFGLLVLAKDPQFVLLIKMIIMIKRSQS